jgi:hypothetical protein
MLDMVYCMIDPVLFIIIVNLSVFHDKDTAVKQTTWKGDIWGAQALVDNTMSGSS